MRVNVKTNPYSPYFKQESPLNRNKINPYQKLMLAGDEK